MTLEGAISLNESNDYIIYTMNSVATGQYGVVVPKNVNGVLNMLVDLHMKNSFDSISGGTKTKEQLVSEISEEYNKLKTKYADGMLVMPMIDENEFLNIISTGDKQKMFDEVKKIGAITSELYKKLTDSGIDKQKIDQKIIMIEKNLEDEKFVVWLKEQKPNFVDGVLYSDFGTSNENANPFVNNGNIFGSVQNDSPKVEEKATVNDIFGAAPSVTQTVPVTPVVEPVTPVEPATPVEPVQPTVSTAEVASNPVPAANIDIFGIPNDVQGVQNSESVPVQNSSVQTSDTSNSSVASSQASVVEGPKPVESAVLEGTMAFDPILNPGVVNDNNNVTPSNSDDKGTTSHGSKGFVNLAILAVILIVVTVISIELGKYLYSVYGA